jgi:hypothetical protein
MVATASGNIAGSRMVVLHRMSLRMSPGTNLDSVHQAWPQHCPLIQPTEVRVTYARLRLGDTPDASSDDRGHKCDSREHR